MSQRVAVGFSPTETRSSAAWPERILIWLEPHLLRVHLALIVITAWHSVTFFHPDEHFQVVEFTGLKLGFAAEEEMAWEYGARVRPFFQPALYYAVARPLVALGFDDRFHLAFVLRLASGLLAFFALIRLLRVSEGWFSTSEGLRQRLRWLTLVGCLPYLSVRTSSENLTQSFFLLGLALVMDRQTPDREAAPGGLTSRSAFDLPVGRALAAGLLFGMAFECRFQTAFAIVGLGAWLLAVGRVRARTAFALGSGFVLTLLLALLLDRWGYGEWVFPPWSYARVNLLEGKAAEFGTKWFFAYLHITLANIFAPVVVLAIVGLTLCWLRRPYHVLTWVTVPFVLAHSLIGHKEERFLFPIMLLSLVGAALGFEAVGGYGHRLVAPATRFLTTRFRSFQSTRVYRGLLLWNLAGMTLLALYPLGWRPHLQFAEWAYRSLEGPVHFVTDDPSLIPDYPFYRRHPWHTHVTGPGQRPSAIATVGAPCYWVQRHPFTGPSEGDADPALNFTEFPGAGSTWVRTHVWPYVHELREGLVALGHQQKRATWLSAYEVRPASAR